MHTTRRITPTVLVLTWLVPIFLYEYKHAKSDKMAALVRLLPPFGGDPNLVRMITFINDTGSSFLSLDPYDLLALGHIPYYAGNLGLTDLLTANGTVQRPIVMVEMQLLDVDGNPVSDWFVEHAVRAPLFAGTERLSGQGMRNFLYFGTAPGNGSLYIAEKKHGLVRQLPTV